MNILFTSSGRRNVLIRHFYDLKKDLGLYGDIFVGDHNIKLSSVANDGRYFPVATPAYDSNAFCPFLISFCKEHNIDIVIPLMDGDLFPLSTYKEAFLSIGTHVVVSSQEAISICNDKRNTHKFFEENKICSPKVLNPNEVNAFPVFLKPYDGIGSRGSRKVVDKEELLYWSSKTKNPLFTEYLSGTEYTIDVYVSIKTNEPKIVVPRRRLEVRAGEVNKSLIDMNCEIINATLDLVCKLPRSEGVLTIQCFLDSNENVSFFEINPRFGGGAPHSIAAGANFPLWIINEFLGVQNTYSCNDNVLMLRYEEAIFV